MLPTTPAFSQTDVTFRWDVIERLKNQLLGKKFPTPASLSRRCNQYVPDSGRRSGLQTDIWVMVLAELRKPDSDALKMILGDEEARDQR